MDLVGELLLTEVHVVRNAREPRGDVLQRKKASDQFLHDEVLDAFRTMDEKVP